MSLLKRFIAVFIYMCALSCVTALPARADTPPVPEFFTMLQDVPLMPGMTEIEEDSFLFDKPEGGIHQASAEVNGFTRAQILSFYKQSLPQFGWSPIKDNEYFRDAQILTISVEDQIVTIIVRPTR